jgi:hypothetical protein
MFDLWAVLADVTGMSGGELIIELVPDPAHGALMAFRRAHHREERPGGSDFDLP